MAKANKIRVRLKAYDHVNLDLSAEKIIAAAKNTGATVVGPIPLPTEKQVFTILRALPQGNNGFPQESRSPSRCGYRNQTIGGKCS